MAPKKLLFHVNNEASFSYNKIGTKAHMLHKISKIAKIPQFWTISEKYFALYLDSCGINSLISFYTNPYSSRYEQLIYRCDSEIEVDCNFSSEKKYIVRSSIVPYENIIDFASEISGAFESIVCNGSNIPKAIIQVYASVFSEKSYNQMRLFSLEQNIKGMAIIIQEYIPAQYSGVIHVSNNTCARLQWLKGHLSEIVTGNEFGHSNFLYYNTKGEPIFRGSEKEVSTIRDYKIADIFASVLSVATRIYDFNLEPQEIEWIYDGHNHWIVQCQKFTEQVVE